MEIIRETYLRQIRSSYHLDLIKVITGVRRAGKSILLSQIRAEISAAGTPEDHIIEINLENIAYEKLRSHKRLNSFILKRAKDKGKYYIFIDEIQHVKSFERVLSSLRVAIDCSIFITGSNSKLLSGKMASLLVGRAIEYKVLPFSFKEALEYLRLTGRPAGDDFIYDYLKWGGMPVRFAYTEEADIRKYLAQTYFGIIDKDIITAKSRINKEKFHAVAKYVMDNAGKEFSAERISKAYKAANGVELDRKEIYRYLDKMECACLIARVKRYNIAGKKTLKQNEKHYAVDVGFRIINSDAVNFDETFFLENIIYNELISRGYEVRIGKTYKGEVDFIAFRNNRKCFIQVTYLLASKETKEREFGAFSPISDCSPKFVFSLDRLDMSRDGIEHVNIVDFLCDRKTLPI